MKNYLSSGMGVNSVALHLLMIDEGFDFEAVFVNHGGDYPETYEYLKMFQEWLAKNNHKPVTVLKPDVNTIENRRFNKIQDYFLFKKFIPMRGFRMCTDKFKIQVANKYYDKPCFVHLGIDAGESHRAKIVSKNNCEYRYILIEYDIDRDDCKRLIKKHGLPVPIKSGCFFCTYQKRSDWILLRRKHPELFCMAQKMEDSSNEKRKSIGKKPIYLYNESLSAVVNEKQLKVFEDDEYPPCQCGL